MLPLNELWFVLVAILFIGFFFLEGFDFGVGMAMRFLAKDQHERRILINTIGPFWDANEVWLLTAGGAMFAAFPHWYATFFSGYYLPLVILLLALIGRGVAFEFRSKLENRRWRDIWDQMIFLGSLLPPFLLGVAFAGIIKGLPIDQQMEMQAGFWDVVSPFTVVGGLTMVLLCLVHGLFFITIRTKGSIQVRARKLAKRLCLPLACMLLLLAGMTVMQTDFVQVRGELLLIIALLASICFGAAVVMNRKKRDGWAFGMMGMVIAFTISAIFVGLFPRVMISSIAPAYDLTIYNAASNPYSLQVMTIVALTLLPFVLGYQIWNYYVFRKRVQDKEQLEY